MLKMKINKSLIKKLMMLYKIIILMFNIRVVTKESNGFLKLINMINTNILMINIGLQKQQIWIYAIKGIKYIVFKIYVDKIKLIIIGHNLLNIGKNGQTNLIYLNVTKIATIYKMNVK